LTRPLVNIVNEFKTKCYYVIFVLDEWKPAGEMTAKLDNALMALIASASLSLSFVDYQL
jgi:hypothetical protein